MGIIVIDIFQQIGNSWQKNEIKSRELKFQTLISQPPFCMFLFRNNVYI